jgi:hypothetical protein
MKMQNVTELLTSAKNSIKINDKLKARDVLKQLLKIDPNNDTAWTYYAYVSESKEQSLACLKKP